MGSERENEEYELSWCARREIENLNASVQEKAACQYWLDEGRKPVPGPHRKSQQPLIAQVTNSWRNDEKAPGYTSSTDDVYDLRLCDPEDKQSLPNPRRSVITSRCFRIMIAVAFQCALFWYAYSWCTRPGMILARGGDFEGTRIMDIAAIYVPGGSEDPHGKRRLVFVGDIHGCKDDLAHLLEKVGFDKKTDHLIATGDVVSKGPDSPGVLDELMRLGAQSVRGNHEDRLLEAAKTLSGSNLRPQSAAATSRQGHSKDETLLRQMKTRHLKYLEDMPLMLRIPVLPQATASSKHGKKEHIIASEILVVHAGLVPHVPLRRQDPYFVMNMRSIDRRTHVPSALRETKHGRSRPWMELWNWYNDRVASGRSLKDFHIYSESDWEAQLARVSSGPLLGRLWEAVTGGGLPPNAAKRPKPQTVVYGHDSKMGLQLHCWSKGLDSACVGGGKLSALVLDAKGSMEIVSVGCKNHKG
ncbi:Uu.00g049870.m01.CDS01 [Anthostomella pinea]|uniref:Uu.00g049870.m01.CDS01 n=1 Tax=Anthostomella pinea TaxID=933095 RepID=A0AAI8VBW6_9PEZI|nr:Uu.00g049870.m01.CDS01 [Anthostomella pinea]